MSNDSIFPPLTDWEPTRRTLHLYSRVAGEIARSHAEFHPKWWHISLKVQPNGLTTGEIPLPDGGSFRLKFDLVQHQLHLKSSRGGDRVFGLTEGLTGSAFGDAVLGAVADLGLSAEYERERFESDGARAYSPDAVATFMTALVNADRIFKDHRSQLDGETSPVQLWPHNFDLSLEWFGTRIETYEEDGHIKEYPSQLNLGFYPGDQHGTAPYFYSNPWPFEAGILLEKPLPEGASWHTEGWTGTILPYDTLAGDPAAETRLRDYARQVFELTSPTLTA